MESTGQQNGFGNPKSDWAILLFCGDQAEPPKPPFVTMPEQHGWAHAYRLSGTPHTPRSEANKASTGCPILSVIPAGPTEIYSSSFHVPTFVLVVTRCRPKCAHLSVIFMRSVLILCGGVNPVSSSGRNSFPVSNQTASRVPTPPSITNIPEPMHDSYLSRYMFEECFKTVHTQLGSRCKNRRRQKVAWSVFTFWNC